MRKYIFGLTLAAVSLVGCSDFLNEPIRGQQDLTEYFKNADECVQQVTGCYQSIFCDDWWQIQKFYLAGDMCTDDMWMGNTTQDPGEYKALAHYTGDTQTGGQCAQNFWQYRYKGILRCNLVIEKIPGVAFDDESLKKRLIAEAKFIRAYHYFDLIRNFGGVPIVMEMKMPHEIIGIKRASVADSYSFVEQDLLDAIKDLPRKADYAQEDLGRATQGAAQGLLAKVYLYQEKYEEAEAQLNEIINVHKGEYRLLSNFGDVWSMDFNNSDESLFEIQTNSDIAYNLGIRMPVVCGSRDDGGWAWGIPTSNLEKAFNDEGDKIRLRWTIIKNGDIVPGDESRGTLKISADSHKSGRISRKLYIPLNRRPEPYDASHIPLNYRILRYADVLLMYAEVENALKKDSEARMALNTVRKRVELDEVPETMVGNELRDAIRKERRLELALENNRLFDLRRWKDDNGQPLICSIMGKNGSFVRYNTVESKDQYETTNQKEASDKGITFTAPRDLLFPIPTEEVTMSNGSIEQNPGY